MARPLQRTATPSSARTPAPKPHHATGLTPAPTSGRLKTSSCSCLPECKINLAVALGYGAIAAGYAVKFETAVGWLAKLQAAHAGNRLEAELCKLRRYKLLITDKVGYILFDSDAAKFFLQLGAHRYKQGAILVTSNIPYGRWGEILADDIFPATMTDRFVHHPELLAPTRPVLPVQSTTRPHDRADQQPEGAEFAHQAGGKPSANPQYALPLRKATLCGSWPVTLGECFVFSDPVSKLGENAIQAN